MGKHTPGPWYVGAPNVKEDAFCGVWGGRGVRAIEFVIADLCNDGFEKTEQLANARLIAAAPELLEACKAALHESGAAYCSEDCDSPAEKLIRAAIAKAEGKE